MLPLEEIKLYLPKYLSPEHAYDLIDALDQFPDNIDERMYIGTAELADKILQGDGINSVPVIDLPDATTREVPAMIISNSCDNDLGNVSFFASRLCYCPIIRLARYKDRLLERGIEPSKIENHLDRIRKQEVFQIFYLPEGSGITEERLIFLNHLISCDADFIYRRYGIENRLFRLSDIGLYIFIIKLSIFFTRITEGIERK